jgi:hypothetical protein
VGNEKTRQGEVLEFPQVAQLPHRLQAGAACPRPAL